MFFGSGFLWGWAGYSLVALGIVFIEHAPRFAKVAVTEIFLSPHGYVYAAP
jgi:hypothetical protein